MLLISNSTQETEQIGKFIGEKLHRKEVIALWGGMGMGKTAMTRGISDAFGMGDLVSSPTFSIVNEYTNERCSIYHFDMYRIHSCDEIESTGFYYYIDKGIVIIEWSENIKECIPNGAINVVISPMETENKRKIEINGSGF